MEIELAGLYVEHVARPTRLQPIAAERLADATDVDLERVGGAWGLTLPPERVDEAVGRDDLVRAEEQQGEQESQLGGSSRS